MERDEYRKHFELEETHWWFAGRREILEATVGALNGLPAEVLILDAGCGTGLNLKIFQRWGETFGFDVKEEALRYCRKRKLSRLARADVQRMPYKSQSFDLIFILDVLSHRAVFSDLEALRSAHHVLKRGGFLLVSDSAFNFLLSRHDHAFHIQQRYTCEGMRKKLTAAGFEVVKTTYFNFFLFVPIIIFRFWDKLWQGDDIPVSHLNRVNSGLNRLLYLVFKAEAPFLRKIRFPFGSSLLCVAKKK